jgi:hypothetical protein
MSEMRRVARVVASAIALCAYAACLPMIAHTPYVDRGLQAAGAEAIVVGRMVREVDSVRSLSVYPITVLRGAYGFRSARVADGPALELGGELIFPEGFLGDAYLQLPRRWTGAVDLGVGAASVLMVPHGPMAYAQAGVRVSDGLYVFTTQSVGRFRQTTDAQLTNPPVTWWQPSIAVQPIRSDDRIRYFFITGTIGHARGRCEGFGTCNPPPGALIAFGFAGAGPVGFPHGRQ